MVVLLRRGINTALNVRETSALTYCMGLVYEVYCLISKSIDLLIIAAFCHYLQWRINRS